MLPQLKKLSDLYYLVGNNIEVANAKRNAMFESFSKYIEKVESSTRRQQLLNMLERFLVPHRDASYWIQGCTFHVWKGRVKFKLTGGKQVIQRKAEFIYEATANRSTIDLQVETLYKKGKDVITIANATGLSICNIKERLNKMGYQYDENNT